MEMMLFCKKVCTEDIQVRFYEEKDGHTIWEDFGRLSLGNVHEQV